MIVEPTLRIVPLARNGERGREGEGGEGSGVLDSAPPLSFNNPPTQPTSNRSPHTTHQPLDGDDKQRRHSFYTTAPSTPRVSFPPLLCSFLVTRIHMSFLFTSGVVAGVALRRFGTGVRVLGAEKERMPLLIEVCAATHAISPLTDSGPFLSFPFFSFFALFIISPPHTPHKPTPFTIEWLSRVRPIA